MSSKGNPMVPLLCLSSGAVIMIFQVPFLQFIEFVYSIQVVEFVSVDFTFVNESLTESLIFQIPYYSKLASKPGMALRKVCVRDSGALVVRRFAYAKSVAYAIRAVLEKSSRVRKSRTQNRIAYVNRVRKSHLVRFEK